MSNTFDWIIERLDAYPQKDEFDDVVFTVHWRQTQAQLEPAQPEAPPQE